MDVATTDRDGILILVPRGALDTRGAIEFERAVGAAVPKVSPRVIIDCWAVETITGAGLRLLVTLSNRIAHLDGALRLCGLSDALLTVFDVAGLADHFTIVATVEEAVDDLTALDERSAADAPLGSSLPLAQHGPSAGASQPPGSASGSGPSASTSAPLHALAARVHAALGSSPDPPALAGRHLRIRAAARSAGIGGASSRSATSALAAHLNEFLSNR